MPETAVYKNDGAIFRKYEVGLSGELSVMKAKAKPAPVQAAAYNELGPSVAPPDAGHHPAANRRTDNIRHFFSSMAVQLADADWR